MPAHLSFNLKIIMMILLSLLLAAEISLDFDPWLEVDVKRPAETRHGDTDQINQLLKPSKFSDYANVITGNIFIVDEVKPVKKVVEVIKPAPQAKPEPFVMQLEITGIVITPGKEMVMVWDRQNKESHVLLKNEKLNKWQVVYIDRHKVSLQSDSGDTHDFILNEELPTVVE